MTEGSARLTITSSAPATLVVAGELDAHTAPELADALAELPADVDVMLDLGELSFMDSSGLRVLIASHRTLSETGQSLTLRHPSRSVQRLLSVSGLDGHLTVEESA
jgi:anti-sigma B factor antagonist